MPPACSDALEEKRRGEACLPGLPPPGTSPCRRFRCSCQMLSGCLECWSALHQIKGTPQHQSTLTCGAGGTGPKCVPGACTRTAARKVQPPSLAPYVSSPEAMYNGVEPLNLASLIASLYKCQITCTAHACTLKACPTTACSRNNLISFWPSCEMLGERQLCETYPIPAHYDGPVAGVLLYAQMGCIVEYPPSLCQPGDGLARQLVQDWRKVQAPRHLTHQAQIAAAQGTHRLPSRAHFLCGIGHGSYTSINP